MNKFMLNPNVVYAYSEDLDAKDDYDSMKVNREVCNGEGLVQSGSQHRSAFN